MDYIEKLLVSQRKKKRIIARRNQGYSAAVVAAGMGCSRQYVDQIYKEHLKALAAMGVAVPERSAKLGQRRPLKQAKYGQSVQGKGKENGDD